MSELSKKVSMVKRRNYDEEKINELYKDFRPYEDDNSFESNKSLENPALKEEFSPDKLDEVVKARA